MLSSTNFNEDKSANQQKQTVITPATVDTIDTEEIVDMVNKLEKTYWMRVHHEAFQLQ